MLQTQKRFCDYLDNVKTELGKASSSGLFEEQQKNIHTSEALKQSIAEAELIVPVVGAFSAGKSTLINAFLGDSLLPVDITPETALATELRYSESEYIEAIKANSEADRYNITDIDAINEKANQYQYAKVFLNSEQLEEIFPLILVDMPGFDSPLDLHHRAILTYLSRGSHYAVLISVEEGTVTRSTLRQLSEFHEFDKTFSVFLSKANLRSDSEVGEIARNIEDRLEDDFDFVNSVVPVGRDGGESLGKMLKTIDPEELFSRLWCPNLEAHFFDLDGRLNTWISSLKKDQRENEEAIDELASGLRDLQRKREEMIRDIRVRYSTGRINSIVDRVGADLSGSVEELSAVIISMGESEFQRRLSETLRTSLVSNVKTEIERLNEQIVEDLSSSLKGIGRILTSYTSDEHWLEKAVPQFQQYVSRMGEYVQDREVRAEQEQNLYQKVTGQQGRNLYRVVTTTLAITTNVVGIALEILIVFLPDIISFFQKRKQGEQIRNQLIGTVIPSIKNKLRSDLPEYFNEQVNLLINEQAELLDSQIQAKRNEIAEAERVKKDATQDIKRAIVELTNIQENIRSLANQVIFTQ